MELLQSQAPAEGVLNGVECSRIKNKELGIRSKELGIRTKELGIRSKELGIRSKRSFQKKNNRTYGNFHMFGCFFFESFPKYM